MSYRVSGACRLGSVGRDVGEGTQPTTFVLPVANSEPHPLLQRSQDAPSAAAWQAELNVRVYQLDSEGATDETEGDVTSCQMRQEGGCFPPRFSFLSMRVVP